MLAKFRGHLRSHVVAYVALFFALSGTALAAKPLLTGAGIQDESLTGADVLNDSLKGADVDEATLSGVDADKLDGQDSSAYDDILDSDIVDLEGATLNLSAFGCSGGSVPTSAPSGKIVIAHAHDLPFNVSLEGGRTAPFFDPPEIFASWRFCNRTDAAISFSPPDVAWAVIDAP